MNNGGMWWHTDNNAFTVGGDVAFITERLINFSLEE